MRYTAKKVWFHRPYLIGKLLEQCQLSLRLALHICRIRTTKTSHVSANHYCSKICIIIILNIRGMISDSFIEIMLEQALESAPQSIFNREMLSQKCKNKNQWTWQTALKPCSPSLSSYSVSSLSFHPRISLLKPCVCLVWSRHEVHRLSLHVPPGKGVHMVLCLHIIIHSALDYS